MNKKEIQLASRNGTLDLLYEQEVNSLIRSKYSISNELAILRQKDAKPAEFAAYNEYVEQCKKDVKAVLYG